jgi:hypothetical protein
MRVSAADIFSKALPPPHIESCLHGLLDGLHACMDSTDACAWRAVGEPNGLRGLTCIVPFATISLQHVTIEAQPSADNTALRQ